MIHREPITEPDNFQIDFSAIDTYLRCAKQFYFRYIQGIKSPPAIAMIEGTSHHKAMEVNNRNKKDKSKDLKPQVLTDVFIDTFRERVKGAKDIKWEGDDENRIHTRAKILHTEYINHLAPKIKPVDIEEHFEKEVSFGKLYGTIDLTDKKRVYDYKTTGKSKSQSEIDNNLQLSLYSHAAEKPEVAIIQFVKTANPYVGLLPAKRSKGDVRWALRVAESVSGAIKAGQFPMTSPTGWQCSERFCGYWGICRGACK